MRTALTLSAVLLLTLGAHAATSFSTKPYPFHVHGGFTCQTAEDFQAALDAQVSQGSVPDALECLMLPPDFDLMATATPVAQTTWDGVPAYITKFEAPGIPIFYGLRQADHAEIQPTSNDVQI